MKTIYKLVDNKIIELENDKEVDSYKDINDLVNREYKLAMHLAVELESSLGDFPVNSSKLKGWVSAYTIKHFEKAFKDNKNEMTKRQFDEEEEKLEESFNSFGTKLYNDLKDNLENKIQQFLENKKTANGGNMFKTTKEAKTFTAHLDALANEIEALEGIAPEMKKHLAFRLDRLSDLVEVSAFQSEKQASVEKEANGVGTGAWAQDSDEKYMNTFGGTGTIEGDADENKYMKEFKGDDHKEVLERKEPAEIAGAGAKKKQPSDNYNEGEVAKNLRNTIKNIMASLSK